MLQSKLNSLLTVSVLFMLFYNSDSVVPYTDTKTNYEALLSAYRTANSVGVTDVIPKDPASGPVTVYMGISLYAIMDFDAVSGKIQLVASMKMEWLDEVKTLTGTTFKETLQTIFVAYDQIWTPNLVLISSVDSIKRIGDETYLVRYNVSSGYCKWYPRMIINAACTPDMTYYPFDKQICTLTVTPWNRNVTELTLSPLTNELNTVNLEKSGQWDVSETSTEAYIGTSNTTRYNIDFKITIKRKPLFLALVIVLPVLLLSLLTGFLFLLPPGSGSRVGFGITCFLSFVVLLQTLMSFMPEVSSPMSILCFYVIVMLSFSVLLSIANVFLLRMYLNPSKEEVPRIFLTVIEVITCKIWRRCPKCPKIKFTFLKKMWQRCPKCPAGKFRVWKGHHPVDYEDDHFLDDRTESKLRREDKVHNIRFARGLSTLKEESVIRNRFTLEQDIDLNKDEDIGGVKSSYDDSTIITDRQLKRSATWFIGSKAFGTDGDDEIYSTEHQLDLARPRSAPALNLDPNTATGVFSSSSSGYLSATSSNKQSRAESRVQSSSGSQSQAVAESGEHSATGSRDQASSGHRSQSAASSHATSSPDSKSEITWEYLAQVFDLFFLAVFIIVQIIFTIFFLVPLGAQY
ncbi:acetylcholine receptor subunit beta-type unc-29-like [Mercenaria mercenaria]|uniref:acetylcholine receptor subunit beta-type unc-29-like n=1 Tax=Mercenaria mercenaria TaxID=6596 RepID=UPI00234E818C|nr:acetylcholine receptor subunit beta-type unc-29-like [Mercenaria mercenaria]